MIAFENSRSFARLMDIQDPLKEYRHRFLLPERKGMEEKYFCGNSLGLQPATAQQAITESLHTWQTRGVEGWFGGGDPWLSRHNTLSELLAPIVGGKPAEIAAMNSLTINLHLLMVSFYRPSGRRFKIMMEGGAFPSDQYAIESQVRFHGYDPAEAIVEIFPEHGETLTTAEIEAAIKQQGGEIALVLFSGVNYYTGQLFDIPAIAKAATDAGAIIGLDLAHAVGNVPLQLHEWNIDFACWCSYKYLNSGPGGIGGAFIHEKHSRGELPGFSGWWGYREADRFDMKKGFVPERGAQGWQVSTPPILLLALHKAALTIFSEVGLSRLREKSLLLTGYLEFLLDQQNDRLGKQLFRIITPRNPAERGCQLSILVKEKGKAIFTGLADRHIIGDWRKPNVIRLSPVPFYNRFEDVYEIVEALQEICEELFPDLLHNL